MVTLAGIEDEIVRMLQQSERVDFPNSAIIVATRDSNVTQGLISSGGITVMYGGSTTTKALVHGNRLERRCVFIVSVGRKMATSEKRITEDIECIADTLTREKTAGVKLTWSGDQHARVHVQTAVVWHDIRFEAIVVAVNE